MEDELRYERMKDNGQLIVENDTAFAMVNRDALNDGHVMVVPKRFVKDVEGLQPQEAHDFLQLIGEMRALIDSLFEDDCLVCQNPVVGRTQPRLHYHVLPFQYDLRRAYVAVEQTDVDARRVKKSPQRLREMADALRSGKKP